MYNANYTVYNVLNVLHSYNVVYNEPNVHSPGGALNGSLNHELVVQDRSSSLIIQGFNFC